MIEPFQVVTLGGSAGSIQPLLLFFDHVEPVIPVAFVVIMHLHREHRSRLDELIEKHTSMPVIRVTKATRLEPGKVFVMAENLFMTIQRDALSTRERHPWEIINKAVNIFLNSLARNIADKGIAIILSGLGDDGAQGAQAVHKAGGKVFVQDPATSQYASMPVQAIKQDSPEAILSPEQLATVLNEYLAAVQANRPTKAGLTQTP